MLLCFRSMSILNFDFLSCSKPEIFIKIEPTFLKSLICGKIKKKCELYVKNVLIQFDISKNYNRIFKTHSCGLLFAEMHILIIVNLF